MTYTYIDLFAGAGGFLWGLIMRVLKMYSQ